jgi:hypothetical protein
MSLPEDGAHGEADDEQDGQHDDEFWDSEAEGHAVLVSLDIDDADELAGGDIR